MEIFRKLRKLMRLLTVPLWRGVVFRHGVAAAIEHAALLHNISCDVVVDVGANRGQFSLAVRHWQPGAAIVAFEPLPAAADAYAVVFRGQDRVTLHRAAIALARGDREMYLSGREDSSSLLEISGLQSDYFTGTEAVGTVSIKTAPLTDFLSPADLQGRALLKIDVQGFELEVLKAAIPLLSSFDWIYVEASFVSLYKGQAIAHEVIDFLRQHNFVLRGVFNLSAAPATGTVIQADFLFSAQG